MTRRFIIVETGELIQDNIVHEFTQESVQKAASAFRILYGEQRGYLLFEQVAVSEPTRSRDEADDSGGEASVLKDFAGLS